MTLADDGKHRITTAATQRLFIDITELAVRQGKTGVQRVTREILRALQAAPPDGYGVVPVVADTGDSYCKLRGFGTNDATREGEVEPRPGDVFLGLDHAMQAVAERADELHAIRARGVRLWFVCNDTLPLDHPEWFPPEQHAAFKRWFETVVGITDGVACISRATEHDVLRWAAALRRDTEKPLVTGVFELGAEPGPVETDQMLSPDEQAQLDRLPDMPMFLMVGTLEPRKGHAQALAAFNTLWEQNVAVALVVVGLPGWMTEVTQRRIRHHEELDRRLFWFMDASDGVLERLYARSTCLLAASEGEGFGLPLVEAARHGLPILCRDLPVFHEVTQERATFFNGRDSGSLAGAVQQWLAARAQGTMPDSREIRRVTWADSAARLCGLVLAN